MLRERKIIDCVNKQDYLDALELAKRYEGRVEVHIEHDFDEFFPDGLPTVPAGVRFSFIGGYVIGQDGGVRLKRNPDI